MTALAQPLPVSPWGTELAVYFVLIGLPSGLTLVACWRRVAWPSRGGAADRAASLLTLGLLAVAGVLLVVDLGRPERFFLMLTRFDNLSSPISIGAKVLALKGLLLMVNILLLQHHRLTPGDTRTRLVSATVTVMLGACSLVLAVYPVAVLNRTWFAPLAGTSGAMLVFLLTALLMGTAVQLLLDALVPGEPAAPADRSLLLGTLATVGAFAVAVGFMSLISLTDPAAAPAREQVGDGGAALWWGGCSVAAGVTLPAVGLALRADRRSWLLISASAILLGACATRYLVVTVGP